MGQTAAEIEYDISRKRHALTGRIDRLENRVRDDVQTSKDRTGERLSMYKEKASGVTGKATEIATTTKGAESPVAEHPKGLVAGSALAGAVLGFLLPSGSSDEDGGQKRSHDHGKSKSKGQQQQQPSSGGGGLASKAIEPLKTALTAQVTAMFSEAMDSIMAKGKEKATGAKESQKNGLSAATLPEPDYDTLPELRPSEMAHSGTRY